MPTSREIYAQVTSAGSNFSTLYIRLSISQALKSQLTSARRKQEANIPFGDKSAEVAAMTRQFFQKI